MECNGKDCFTIYSVIYPNLQESIDSSFETIDKEISETIEELSKIVVPDDYLGNKIKDRLVVISNEFNANKIDTVHERERIDRFIQNNEKIHEQHYINYLDKIEKEKEENDKLT